MSDHSESTKSTPNQFSGTDELASMYLKADLLGRSYLMLMKYSSEEPPMRLNLVIGRVSVSDSINSTSA